MNYCKPGTKRWNRGDRRPPPGSAPRWRRSPATLCVVVVKDLLGPSDHHHNHPHHLASLASMVSSAIARHRASSAAFSLACSSRGYWYLGWWWCEKTRPSILCVTHQMSRKKRDYSVDWTVPYEMMNYKWYLMVLGQYMTILAGTWSV